MNGVTDVGQKKSSPLSPGYYDWKSSKLNMGIYFAAMYKSTVEGRAELTYGAISGDDTRSNSRYVQTRNLSFKSKIFELSLTAALHPILLFNDETLPMVSPYIIAGVGLFSYYPKTEFEGETIALRRWNTEGQNSTLYPARQRYGVRAISIPLGGGLKYEYSAKINFRFEALYRLTNSDYLDDASTRFPDRSVFATDMEKLLSHRYLELNPNDNRTNKTRGSGVTNDRFFTLSFKAGYVLGREKIRK
jgi:hypothetical protein